MAQAGFILTRHWRDTPQGTEVSFWLATDNGPLQVTLAPQESVAFIPADQVPRAQHILQGEQGFRLTPLALKDFHRQPVYGLYCRAHRQLMNYEKRLREGGVTVFRCVLGAIIASWSGASTALKTASFLPRLKVG